MLKRKIMFAGFFALCLLATVYIGAAGILPYDPWSDINDDGIIDIEDLSDVSLRLWEQGSIIDKAAIAYNSTVVYKSASTDSYMGPVDMPGTNVTITLNRTSDLLIMFSAEACTNKSDGRIILYARVDSGGAEPMNVLFTPTVSAATTDGHSHTLGYAAYAYNFLYYGLGVGTYTVKIQWMVDWQTMGYVYYRTLAVLAVNQ